MRPFALAFAVFLGLPAAASSQNQVPSIRDIIELSKAGLADEVILTLIEVHRPVYPVDAQTLKGLKTAGVSPNVIVAMIRSGRPSASELETQPALPAVDNPPVAPAAPVVIVEREVPVEEPRVREIAVPVPIYIPVGTRHHDGDARRHRPAKPVEPVYWGFGGKLRPDAWKPTAADVQKDAKIPREPQRK